MDLSKDIVDKYTTEQVIAYLAHLIGGVSQNYRTALKTGRPEFLWGSLGDVIQAKDILLEMKSRNDAREATKQV